MDSTDTNSPDETLPSRPFIMKFGGTSLRDAAAVRHVATLIADRLGQRPIVVVSAHAGVTDALVRIATEAVDGSPDIDGLEELHAGITADLGIEVEDHSDLFGELRDLCQGITLVSELSRRSKDYVVSFGERLSARTLAATLRATGTDARAFDAFDIGVHSDRAFGRARLLPDEGRIAAALSDFTGVPVVTGFIAKDDRGNITTIGRNGSDLSAAFFGNALDASEIQIWTDVDGVLTADPKIVPGAQPISRMTYDEAAELANAGGKVLHPASLRPAVDKSIPVRVLNTHRSESPGTVIVPEFDEPAAVARCIAHKRHVTLVSVESSSMLAQAGFLARIFAAFEHSNISVDLVSTSEVSVSMTLDNIERLDEAVRELEQFSHVTVERELGMLCVVGHGIRHRMGVPARVFAPLRDAGVSVRMISLGALKVNVSLVVGSDDVDKAVRALHAEFFEGSASG